MDKRKFKADHFDSMEELLTTIKSWLSEDYNDLYWAFARWFDVGAMEEMYYLIIKQKKVIDKVMECINNSTFGYSDWECQKPLYLKDDEVGKELLSILEDKEV